MLSAEQNEMITRVGPGTPMGELFRHYWIPFLPSSDLETDGEPMRVRLLCEDLVAFRDSEGMVGLVAHACPHRGAPMLFARNEDCGLRCVYHGWKFHRSGQTVDMPAEPEQSRYKEKVRIKAYPCQERNGVVWAWMGKDAPPPLPHFEWNMTPPENVVVTFRVQECNWLQALEGEIDSAHAPILHGRADAGGFVNQWRAAADLRPTFECVRQDFGVSIASRRAGDEGSAYWRVNQFVLPFFTCVPPQSNFPELSGHAWMPIDDETTMAIMFSYVPNAPMYEKSRRVFLNGHKGRQAAHATRDVYEPKNRMSAFAKYWTKFNPDNAYHFNYSDQKSTYNSGLPGLWVQDAACQSGVAAIYDRTQEHLGVSDTGIVATRRMLLKLAADLRDKGQKPLRCDDPDLYMVRAISVRLPRDADWRSECKEYMRAEIGKGFGYEP
ncbi:MAG: Rieske 2Fe-2S domain-containing protein [Hyphomicrobiales bacterium]|nr:Rieske 2Fe-2S domain-containing protein [Hyphomicrobiales bacterium]